LISLVDRLGDAELPDVVDADEQVELAFGGPHLSDVHLKKPMG